jgi:hypothetical protein
MLWRESGPQEASAISASDLKICDLCGALNLALNQECFICRWRGRFEQRAEFVRLAMELAQRQYGKLEPWLFSSGLNLGPEPHRRFAGTIARGLRKVIDWLRG